MSKTQIKCKHCGKEVEKRTGHVNRARKLGANLYCSRKCAGDARRMPKSEKVELKRLYDIEYRKKNREKILARKKKYHQENYDKIYAKQREKRDNDEARAKHAAYCRQPEQREKERINRYKRVLGNDWQDKTKFCICCEKDKHIYEFEHSSSFPDNRRHICDECEAFQNHHYGYSTRLTMAAMKSRRYTNLTYKDFGKHPYLIEANKFLILLKRELR